MKMYIDENLKKIWINHQNRFFYINQKPR